MRPTTELDAQRLYNLLDSIFAFRRGDHHLLFAIDLPRKGVKDTKAWRWLRETATDWFRRFPKQSGSPTCSLVFYPATGTDGSDLPKHGVEWFGGNLPRNWEGISSGPQTAITDLLDTCNCAVWATQFSATGPLKRLVAKHHLTVRVATLPGFTRDMWPAFLVDYVEATRRIATIKTLVDQAVAADIDFLVDGADKYRLHVDLRGREQPEYECHASTGRIIENGQVGNGISGEGFVKPYNRRDSETEGWIPIQHRPNEPVVLYCFAHNLVVKVVGEGRRADDERLLMVSEKPHVYLGELGFGVLDGLGAKIPKRILDPDALMLFLEKFTLHVAFENPTRHADKVFLKECMPRIRATLTLVMADGSRRVIVVNNGYAPGIFA
ncbi:MAG: hypothetical protein V1716_05300 [Candidatus Uhrbacteria bacterium]